jgi:hypothetical protein
MRHLSLLLTSALVFTLAACGAPTASESPTTVPTAAPTRTPRPTPEPRPSATPEPTAAPTELPIATYTAELSATVAASLPPTTTPESGDAGGFFAGIEGVEAQPLKAPASMPPLWAVSSRGMRNADPPQNHFVAIYARAGDGWKELDRAELENYDFFAENGLAQVDLDPRYVWLEAQGGAGAHSGCYDLLRFDGKQLHDEVSACSSSPGAGELKDVNGDGTPDVVLNATNYYVFCYACGVREVNYQVLRWDGDKMAQVELTRLPDSAPAKLRDLNNQAIDLAEHGFWKDARATVEQAAILGAQDQAATWNAALIRLVAGGRAEQAKSDIYPLLDNLYYGDYPAALDAMRAYTPEQLFAADTPLVKGGVAEGWEPELAHEITTTTELALQLQPDLAAAHFLRGWALHLANPGSPDALAEIERAAALDPNDKLFAESVAYLRR